MDLKESDFAVKLIFKLTVKYMNLIKLYLPLIVSMFLIGCVGTTGKSPLPNVDYADCYLYSSFTINKLKDSIEKTGEFSGLTYNSERNTYYGIARSIYKEVVSALVVEFDENFHQIGSITIPGVIDPEDIVFLEMTKQGPHVAIVDEIGIIYIGVLLTKDKSGKLAKEGQLNINNFKSIKLKTIFGNNTYYTDDDLPLGSPEIVYGSDGLEGIAHIPQENKFIIVKEKNPIQIYSFTLPKTGNVAIIKSFLAEKTIQLIKNYATDLSAVAYDPDYDRIILLSDESQTVFYLNNKTKQITRLIKLNQDYQYEAIVSRKDKLIIGAEPNFWIDIIDKNLTKSKNCDF